ncbi:MAG: SEC-C metal-binding domain-containing protein [Solirubrobacteraceae bacterium]
MSGNVLGLHLSNNTESCPRCGGQAQILEGTFNVRDGVVEVLRATVRDRELLLRFAGLARQAQVGSLAQDEAVRQIARESPEIERLLQRVPKNLRKVLIWVLLQAIVVLAAQGVADLRDDSATPADVQRIVRQHEQSVRREVQVAVEQALDEYHRGGSGEPAQDSGRRHTTKTSRNALCPCGSGQKHKKCCGR